MSKKLKSVEKIRQYRSAVHIDCVGHPSIAKKGERTVCKKSVIVNVYDARNSRALSKAVFEVDWRSLKTLGQRQFFCPKCSAKIIEMRKEVKFLWG